MQINLTLAVQAFNFFFAYVVLKRFLFAPAVAVLQKEETERESLLAAIEKREVANKRKEKQMQDTWQVHQEHFQEQTPPEKEPDLVAFESELLDIKHEPIDEKIVTSMIDDAEQALAQRIRDV